MSYKLNEIEAKLMKFMFEKRKGDEAKFSIEDAVKALGKSREEIEKALLSLKNKGLVSIVSMPTSEMLVQNYIFKLDDLEIKRALGTISDSNYNLEREKLLNDLKVILSDEKLYYALTLSPKEYKSKLTQLEKVLKKLSKLSDLKPRIKEFVFKRLYTEYNEELKDVAMSLVTYQDYLYEKCKYYYDMINRALNEINHLRKLSRNLVDEILSVFNAYNIQIEKPFELVMEVAKLTGDNISSMLQDVMKGRKTEIDFINGAIINLGKKKNIKTPLNETIYHLIKTLENAAAYKVIG